MTIKDNVCFCLEIRNREGQDRCLNSPASLDSKERWQWPDLLATLVRVKVSSGQRGVKEEGP